MTLNSMILGTRGAHTCDLEYGFTWCSRAIVDEINPA